MYTRKNYGEKATLVHCWWEGRLVQPLWKTVWEFQPRWRCRWKCFISSHNQKKDNNQFKHNKQPEVPENQTAWNSDNQGVKEIFTQPTRRSGDGRQAAEQRGCAARHQTVQEWQGWLNRKLKTQKGLPHGRNTVEVAM